MSDDITRKRFLKYGLLTTTTFFLSAVSLSLNPNTGFLTEGHNRVSTMPTAMAMCGSGLNCSGGGGQCGSGLNCAGGGGRCGSGLNCSGGGGQCGSGLNCSGGGGRCGSGLNCAGGGGRCGSGLNCAGS